MAPDCAVDVIGIVGVTRAKDAQQEKEPPLMSAPTSYISAYAAELYGLSLRASSADS